jgi:hypothetical protein
MHCATCQGRIVVTRNGVPVHLSWVGGRGWHPVEPVEGEGADVEGSAA